MHRQAAPLSLGARRIASFAMAALALRGVESPRRCREEADGMMHGNVAAVFQERQEGHLPGELGLVWEEVANGRARGHFTVEKKHMAPNGYMHAASVIALVDSACGYACVASLPDGATGFTTIEIKTNYLGSARIGEVVA